MPVLNPSDSAEVGDHDERGLHHDEDEDDDEEEEEEEAEGEVEGEEEDENQDSITNNTERAPFVIPPPPPIPPRPPLWHSELHNRNSWARQSMHRSEIVSLFLYKAHYIFLFCWSNESQLVILVVAKS